jgi:D-threo-aldose 1-dehydrogenase
MDAVCKTHKVPLAAAALQFSMRDPRITSTIVGMSKVERLAHTVELAHIPVPNEVWPQLDAVGYSMDDPEAGRWK